VVEVTKHARTSLACFALGKHWLRAAYLCPLGFIRIEPMKACKYLFLFVTALLVGCASVADLTTKQQSKANCCKSPAEFKYEPLLSGSVTSLSLNDESPVYTFASGKSYFQAYVLPTQRNSTKLRVRSSITGSSAFETIKLSQVYCPHVSFLNSSYETLSSKDMVPLVARGSQNKGILPTFIADFEIPTDAVYAVLHSSTAGYGRLATRYTGGGGYMVGNTFVMDRGGEAIQHPCGPTANAEISLL
jgi:uncharacterized protein YceK